MTEGKIPGGWGGEGRQRRRENPDDYPGELREVLPRAIQELKARMAANYGNPAWEPVIGVLEAKLAEIEDGDGDG